MNNKKEPLVEFQLLTLEWSDNDHETYLDIALRSFVDGKPVSSSHVDGKTTRRKSVDWPAVLVETLSFLGISKPLPDRIDDSTVKICGDKGAAETVQIRNEKDGCEFLLNACSKFGISAILTTHKEYDLADWNR